MICPDSLEEWNQLLLTLKALFCLSSLWWNRLFSLSLCLSLPCVPLPPSTPNLSCLSHPYPLPLFGSSVTWATSVINWQFSFHCCWQTLQMACAVNFLKHAPSQGHYCGRWSEADRMSIQPPGTRFISSSDWVAASSLKCGLVSAVLRMEIDSWYLTPSQPWYQDEVQVQIISSQVKFQFTIEVYHFVFEEEKGGGGGGDVWRQNSWQKAEHVKQ